MPTPIATSLLPLAIPVDNLVLDATNARRGDVAAIRRSLNVFGQRKPVVVKRTGQDAQGRPTGVVIAGNHTLSAALELGWAEIAAVFVEDDDQTAKAYALADNRTAELATWDYEQLATTLAELQDSELDLTDLGWQPHELEGLLGATWTPAPPSADLESFSNGRKHAITLSDSSWPIVERALNLVREQLGDLTLTDEAALIHVCQGYTAEPRGEFVISDNAAVGGSK
jgi:hypothetical protein